MEAIRRELRENPHSQKSKPERTEWRGRRGKGGLGVSTKDVMTTMVDLFSAQIFKWGVVHCDPRKSYQAFSTTTPVGYNEAPTHSSIISLPELSVVRQWIT